MKIKKICALSLLFGIALSINTLAQSYSWYFKPEKDGKQPVCMPEAAFKDNYPVIYLGNPEEKKIYLTFDAGYENGNVEKILDILKKHNAPGAFFVLPQIVKENTDLIKRMQNEGHLVCNHSNTHRNMSKVEDFDTFKEEIVGAEDIFREVTGTEMDKFYRPPEGAFSEKNLEYAQKLGYTTVFWSLAYADWDNSKQIEPSKALSLVKSRTHNGCVALLHPTSATNAAILDDYITDLENEGYIFCSLRDFDGR